MELEYIRNKLSHWSEVRLRDEKREEIIQQIRNTNVSRFHVLPIKPAKYLTLTAGCLALVACGGVIYSTHNVWSVHGTTGAQPYQLGTPQLAVYNWLEAVTRGDVVSAIQYVHDTRYSSQSELIQKYTQQFKDEKLKSFEIGNVSFRDAQHATVNITLAVSNQRDPVKVTEALEKVAGEWKVNPAGATVSHTVAANVSTLTPQAVVTRYYSFIGNGDFTNASQLLAPELTTLYQKSPDSDFNNVSSLGNVKITAFRNDSLDKNYKNEVQVTVSFYAQYKQMITTPSGNQIRFIYLGRNSSAEPWKIISIGTGP